MVTLRITYSGDSVAQPVNSRGQIYFASSTHCDVGHILCKTPLITAANKQPSFCASSAGLGQEIAEAAAAM